MKYFFWRFNLDKILIALFFALSSVTLLMADEIPVIRIKEHRFSPPELRIPVGKKIKILVNNEDAEPEEFESYELRREKFVSGHSAIVLYVGPLKPGVYKYFGDFHPQTAQGRLIAEGNS